MSDDILDGLLGSGDEKPKPRQPFKQVKGRRLNKDMIGDAEVREDTPHAMEFMRPVGITFIAEVVGKQPAQIKRRLAQCPVIGTQRTAGKEHPLYDFMTALSYLLEPKGNIEDWFASKNAATLPPYVNKMFWDSAHQRSCPVTTRRRTTRRPAQRWQRPTAP